MRYRGLLTGWALSLGAVIFGPAGASQVSAAEHPEAITNSIGMRLVPIPAGEFLMGADENMIDTLNYFPYYGADWLQNERPQHKVRITKPFLMGQYEVTLREFLIFYFDAKYKLDMERDGKPTLGYAADGQTLIESPNFRPWAPGWKIEQDHPAVDIAWDDAVAFCRWLSAREGKKYRLPTEAEWEYCCRAGTDTRYFFGNDPEQLVYYANVADADRKAISANAVFTRHRDLENKTPGTVPFPFVSRRDGYAWTAPVGQFVPNAFGLYDMHGNVWEWCSDWYDRHYYEHSPEDDPQGAATGEFRVTRGGGFYSTPAGLRCAHRDRARPSYRDFSQGFRVVCEE